MTKTIMYCGYREWSLKIYDILKDRFKSKVNFELCKTQEEFEEKIEKVKPNLVFFIGWSWIIDKEIVTKNTCVCLHPSPLPKYRGGSPIQNQIINGEDSSAVTFFIMDEFIDKGPIVWQKEFSLAGDLQAVLDRITELGKEGVSELIDTFLKEGRLAGTSQKEEDSTYFKRRTPDMSEIKVSDFENCTARELHDKIRALQDPYPNAFVVCKDGTKLYLQKSKLEEK